MPRESEQKIRHDIDPETWFCRICGKASMQIFSTSEPCVEGDKVVGISHIRAKARLSALLGVDQENCSVATNDA